MNIRLLYVVLAVQALFGGALLYVGYTARENRKTAYLELTHRVTAGTATEAEFEKLLAFLPANAEKDVVRSLFGLPVVRRGTVAREPGLQWPEKVSEVWVYYPVTAEQLGRGARIDAEDQAKLSGKARCLVVVFDERGRAHAHLTALNHPL